MRPQKGPARAFEKSACSRSRRCSERERAESEIRTVRNDRKRRVTWIVGWREWRESKNLRARSANRRLRGARRDDLDRTCEYYLRIRNIKDDFPCTRLAQFQFRPREIALDSCQGSRFLLQSVKALSHLGILLQSYIKGAAASLTAACNSIVTHPV